MEWIIIVIFLAYLLYKGEIKIVIEHKHDYPEVDTASLMSEPTKEEKNLYENEMKSMLDEINEFLEGGDTNDTYRRG